MRFISFASNIGPAAAVPAGLAPAPLVCMHCFHPGSSRTIVTEKLRLQTASFYLKLQQNNTKLHCLPGAGFGQLTYESNYDFSCQ